MPVAHEGKGWWRYRWYLVAGAAGVAAAIVAGVLWRGGDGEPGERLSDDERAGAAAIVNGEAISKRAMEYALGVPSIDAAPVAQRRDVLDGLIDGVLLDQEATKSVEVAESEVDAAIQQQQALAASDERGRAMLQAEVERAGMTIDEYWRQPELRELHRRILARPRYIEALRRDFEDAPEDGEVVAAKVAQLRKHARIEILIPLE